MQMDIDRKDLVSLLDRVAPAATDGAIVTMVRTIRLEARIEGLRCYAVGTTMSVESSMPAVLLKKGICQADSVRLASAAAAMPDGTVSLKYGAEKLVVSAGKRKFTLPTFTVEDFPEIPKSPTTDTFVLPAEAIAAAVERVSWAADRDREHIHGVMLSIRPGEVTAVALSGSSWGMTRIPVERLSGQADIFLPDKILRSVKSLCSADDKELINLSSDGRRVFISSERTLVTSLLPLSPFLDWRPVLAKLDEELQELVSVDGAELQEAARACVVASGEKRPIVSLTFSGNQFSVAIDEAGNPEIAGGIEVSADFKRQDALKFLIDGDNLVQSTKHCDRALIGGGVDQQPLRIRSEDGTYSAVLMPISRGA
jgi:DNA polymerase-3 subunit beta